jgi:hypothetical protein
MSCLSEPATRRRQLFAEHAEALRGLFQLSQPAAVDFVGKEDVGIAQRQILVSVGDPQRRLDDVSFSSRRP